MNATLRTLLGVSAIVAACGTCLAGDPPASTPPSAPPAAAPGSNLNDGNGKPIDPAKARAKVNEQVNKPAPAPMPAAPAPGQPGQPFNPGATPGVAQPLPQGKGLLTFAETDHHFGKVYDTTPRKWVAKFKNTGSEKLVISQVRPGCGCTAAALSDYEYDPGEEGQIELTWNPTGIGEVSKPVTITSNDMNEPNKVINIKATMVPLVKLDPMFLQGGTIQAGNERPLRLVVQSRDKDFQIKTIDFENNISMPWKEVPDESKVVDESYPGRRAIEFMIPKDAPVGSYMRSMNIVVAAKIDGQTDPTESRYNVRCFANIVGDLMATPAYITIASARPNTPFEQTVTLTSRSGKAFEIKSAEVIDVNPPSVAGLTAKAEALPENKGWKLTLAGNPGQFVGAFRGTVRLVTSNTAEGPTLVPFSGMSMQAPTAPPAPSMPAAATPAPGTPGANPPVNPTQATPKN